MELNKILTSVIFTFLLLTFALLPLRQASAQVGENRYLVYFSDKDNTPYSVANPEAYLSEKALDRRDAQGIAIDALDLPVDPAYIQVVRDLGDLNVIYPLKWMNAILIETTDPDVITAIENLGIVDAVELSRILSGDPYQGVKGRFDGPKSAEDYGAALNQIDMLNGLPLHEDGFRGAGVWVAIFDAGFSNIPNTSVVQPLLTSDRVLGTLDFVHGGNFVYDYSNHGAYVLSIMAADEPLLMIGTAPDASYLLCVTEDVGSERRIEEANWIAAAEYADSIGIDVINTSLGYTQFDTIIEDYTYADMDGNTALITRGSDIAASRGMLVINSAGNEGGSAWNYISAPADGDSVLAIGSVNSNGLASGFSSRGPSFDGRVKPNVMAQGGSTVISDLADSITMGSGTSFSGPVLSGMAASLWGAFPSATAMEVFHAIEMSASLYNMPNDSMGYGIPDFEIARDLLSGVVSTRNEAFAKGKLAVYPNPTTGEGVRIAFPDKVSGTAILRLFDLSGRLIYTQRVALAPNLENSGLNGALQAAETGVYLLEIRSENGQTMTVRIGKL